MLITIKPNAPPPSVATSAIASDVVRSNGSKANLWFLLASNYNFRQSAPVRIINLLKSAAIADLRQHSDVNASRLLILLCRGHWQGFEKAAPSLRRAITVQGSEGTRSSVGPVACRPPNPVYPLWRIAVIEID